MVVHFLLFWKQFCYFSTSQSCCDLHSSPLYSIIHPLSVCLSFCLSVRLFLCLSLCLSVSVYPFVYLSLCVSVIVLFLPLSINLLYTHTHTHTLYFVIGSHTFNSLLHSLSKPQTPSLPLIFFFPRCALMLINSSSSTR